MSETESELEPAPVPSRRKGPSRRARRLYLLCSTSLAALLVYYAITAEVSDTLHLYQGLAMIFLAAWPGLRWAKSGSEQLPVFEVFMLTTANAFAFPLLTGHAELRAYPPELITRCGFAVLLFQAVAVLTHLQVGGRPGTGPFFSQNILGPRLQHYLGYALLLCTAYTFIYVFHEELIPYEIGSVLRAVFFGLGIVSTFAQARRWGRNELRPDECIVFILLVAAQVLMQFSTLFLVGGLSVLILALVGYVVGSHRLPIVAAIVVFGLMAVLHNGKSAMRAQYWDETGYHRQVSVEAVVPFFVEWVEHGLTLNASSGGSSEMSKKLLDRSSLFQILCLIASYTPDYRPYLEGKTYAQIPAQFVPRFLWPNKPVGHISTYTLAIYYGLQSEEDTQKTTIGFGMIAEAYANFGFWGVGVLGALLGVFYKKVQILTSESPLLSYAGLYLVVLMAWSFQSEYTLSIWLSSMFQACVAVIGLPYLATRLLR